MPVEETKQEARKRRCRESARRSWLKRKLLGIPETLEHREIRLARERARKKIATRTPKYQEYIKRYYANNRQKLTLYARNRHARNPVPARVRASTRRAQIRTVVIGAEQIQQWAERIKSKDVVRCYYCDGLVSAPDIQIDHVLALARGGEHSLKNLCAACRTCNLSKRAQIISDWHLAGQQILSL